MSRWSRGCGTGIGLSGHTNQYRHGVTIENWVEDTHAISALKNNSTLLGRQSRDAVPLDESLTSTYMRSFTSEVRTSRASSSKTYGGTHTDTRTLHIVCRSVSHIVLQHCVANTSSCHR